MQINPVFTVAQVFQHANADVNYLFGSDLLRDGLNDAGLQKLSEFRSILLDSPRYREEAAIKRIPVYFQFFYRLLQRAQGKSWTMRRSKRLRLTRRYLSTLILECALRATV